MLKIQRALFSRVTQQLGNRDLFVSIMDEVGSAKFSTNGRLQ